MDHRFSLFTLALASAAALLSACAEGQPKIRCAEPRFDFGEVYEQESYTHEFVLENTGDADLVIEKVKPGGGGFRPEFDRVIPPGQKGIVRVELPGEKVHGRFSKPAIVYSNDPVNPEFRLDVTGAEIRWVEIMPTERVYLEAPVGGSAEKLLTARSNETGAAGLDFVVEGARSTIDSLITYDVVPGSAKGEYEVVVRTRPEAVAVARNDYGALTLLTNSERRPEVVIQVQVTTTGPIVARPITVNFGAVEFADLYKSAPPVTESVELISEQDEFDIQEITFDRDRCSSQVNEIVAGWHYRIEVTFDPPRKVRERQREVGEMIVHTTHPAQPTVRVKLVARAR